jgi:natural product biosynthesis luciferase-like monooxygenase protein
MNLNQLMLEIKRLQIKLKVEDGNLRFSAPKDTLNPTIKQALKEHKASLIDFMERKTQLSVAQPSIVTDESSKIRAEKPDGALSFAQQRLLFMSQISDATAAYNIPAAYRFKGQLKIDALQSSINALVMKHTSLRTCFSYGNGHFIRHIADTVEAPINIVDLTAFDKQTREIKLSAIISEQANEEIDTTVAPLMRVTLVKLAENEHAFLLTKHHLISDGWSFKVMWKDLWQYYLALESGLNISVTPANFDYTDFIKWQEGWMEGNEFNRQKDYWVSQLQDCPEFIELPTDRPRPKVPDYVGDALHFELPVKLIETFNKLGTQCGASLYMTMLTAFYILLNKYTGQDDILVGTPVANRRRQEWEEVIGLFANVLVLRQKMTPDTTFKQLLSAVRETSLSAYEHQDFPFEKVVQYLQPERNLSYSPLFQVMFALEEQEAEVGTGNLTIEPLHRDADAAKFDITLTILRSEKSATAAIGYCTALFDKATIEGFFQHYLNLLTDIVSNVNKPISQLSILSEPEIQVLTGEWNQTSAVLADQNNIVDTIFTQCQKTPEEIAVVFEDQALSFKALEASVEIFSQHLLKAGVKPEARVGILLDRMPQTIVVMLAIMKVGGAYVPLDSNYPRHRIQSIIQDAELMLLVTSNSLPSEGLAEDTEKLIFENCQNAPEQHFEAPVVYPENLAYVIYTSGSTGKPKGVMVTHHNVLNLFTGLDSSLSNALQDVNNRPTMRALTSISFDISVLELLWTLARGHQVLLEKDHFNALSHLASNVAQSKRPLLNASTKGMDFSLFYFASDSDHLQDKYKLLMEGAAFADANDFSAIWVPERHFHAFGGHFPNPSVAAAAVAATTKKIQIRAGSCVVPLHHPVRVAEEWSMVDNLSNGRAAIAFASGWHFNDFVLAPDNFEQRHKVMRESINSIRKLWAGESIEFKNGKGEQVPVRIKPDPVNKELPIWITAAGHPDTFKYAGEIGANLLTHLLGQTLSELQEKIAIYRQARADNGFDSDEGKVTLMMHTFLSDNSAEVEATVEKPFKDYLRNSLNLLRPVAESQGMDTDADFEAVVNAGFKRYSKSSALFGTPEACLGLVDEIAAIGVNEVACLIDFGVEQDKVIDSFTHIDRLKNLARSNDLNDKKHSVEPKIINQQASHIQCTPSFAKLLLEQPSMEQMLKSVQGFYVGGEALTPALASELKDKISGELFNMYGPTETTVWSAIHQVQGNECSIGKPVANTQLYVLDEQFQLVPVGVKGELFIGGEGVTRGYRSRPDLTAERFLPDPFGGIPGQRLYRTGDAVRRLTDGTMEYLARLDNQVKVRGFRVELGEIESALLNHDSVKDAVVIVHTNDSQQGSIFAYVVSKSGEALDKESLLTYIRSALPDYMVPSNLFILPSIPVTPNGKIDRKALPTAPDIPERVTQLVPAGNVVEAKLVDIWKGLLKLDAVGVNENFFEIGGHSLLLGQLQQQLTNEFTLTIKLIELFNYPTIKSLAARIKQDKSAPASIRATRRHQDNKVAVNEMRKQMRMRKHRG